MEFDLHSEIKIASVITPTAGAAAGASTVGSIIDTLGFESFEYVIQTGTITTGTFSLTLQEADDVGFTVGVQAVPAANLLGASPTWIVSDDNQVRRVGIIGKKRFQRLTLVGASTPVGAFSACAILGNPGSAPTAAQATTS
jgi:hypothetical protein